MTQAEINGNSGNGGNNGGNGGNNGNTKQECPLRVNYNANFTLTAGNTSINLNNYILTESTGAVTFNIYTLDRSQVMGANADGTFNFSNGSGIVVVHQDADDNYQAGDLEFTITVGGSEKKTKYEYSIPSGATSVTATWSGLYDPSNPNANAAVDVYTPWSSYRQSLGSAESDSKSIDISAISFQAGEDRKLIFECTQNVPFDLSVNWSY